LSVLSPWVRIISINGRFRCFLRTGTGRSKGWWVLEGFKRAGRRVLDPFVNLLATAGVSPFLVTVAGLFITILASWFIWKGCFLEGGLLLTVGSIMDAMDGALARKSGTSSKAGAVLDSSSDRIGELLVLGALLTGRAGESHSSLEYLVPAAIGGSFMVSYIRARAEGVKLSCSVGIFTRTERLVLLITGILAADIWGTEVIVWLLVLMTAGTWLTAVQRLMKVTRDGRGIPLEDE